VSVPASRQHALAQDEVDVAAFTDAEAGRMSIWDRTAPWPMTFWVGRWVAATMVTAAARPSRAMESVYLAASGASSASSAYSSMMITSGGHDLKKGMELGPWQDCIGRLATDARASHALLRDAVAILHAA